MEPAHLIAFNIALLVAIASPGPSLLYLIRTTLVAGRATGIAAAAGLGCMAALWTAAALLGLEGLFRLFPWAYGTLKVAGALYLMWIAWSTWRSARDPVGSASAPTHRRAFLSGVLVNLANPKSVFFAAAVLVVIFPPGLTSLDNLLIFINHLCVELIVQPALAIALSAGAVRRRYLGLKPVLDRAAALVLGCLGIRLLVDR